MTEADKARQNYKNSLKDKVNSIVLRSFKRLPWIINSHNWGFLEDNLEMCYTFLGEEPISKVNDLINHIIAREVERFGAEDQAIVNVFKEYLSIKYPDVLVAKCVMETGPNIRELRNMLSNKSIAGLN